jgi:hypothetical protein
MPVPSGNPIKLSDLIAEFGSDGSPSMRDYYRGGPRVPNSATNAAISTDPNSLRLTQFYGARSFAVDITNYYKEDGVLAPGGATAGIYLNNDGTVTLTATNYGNSSSSWGVPTTAGVGATYYARFTYLSGGTVPNVGGGLGNWIQISAGGAYATVNKAVSAGQARADMRLDIATAPNEGSIIDTSYPTIIAFVDI